MLDNFIQSIKFYQQLLTNIQFSIILINNIKETRRYRIVKFYRIFPPKRSDYKYSLPIHQDIIFRERMSICIGEGGFGNVFLQFMGPRVVACKKIDLPRNEPLRYLYDEINAFRDLDHPNIVKLLGYRHLITSFEIAFEYIHGSTLDVKYKLFVQKGLSRKQIQQHLFYWIFQIALALIELEQKGIVHRDLKPKNILLNDNGIIKIIDFGISKILHNNKSSVVGTVGFIAPEIVFQKMVSNQSDVWSLGTTIYYLLYEKLPFDSGWVVKGGDITLDKKVFNQGISFQKSKCSQQMNSLLKMMLQIDPRKRIKAKDILSHSALKSREVKFASQYRYNINRK